MTFRPLLICALALVGVLVPAGARAVPAPPFPITVRHADGTGLQARMLGDEHLSWVEDLEGFTLALEPKSRDWHFARLGPTGELESSGIKAGSLDPRGLSLSRHLRPGPAQQRSALRARAERRPAVRRAPLPPGETVIRNLVLLVKFSNQTPTFTREDFDLLFNGAENSVQAYYREISYGKVKLVSTVVDWIALPQPDRFYAYNSSRPYGQPEQMIRDAVAILEERGFDFTEFDADKDGIIDAVGLIHSGGGYETTGNPDHIHSHFADLSQGLGRGGFTTRDGIKFVAYHTEPEFGASSRNITRLGVICHETAHFFGLPDLYDYDYDSSGLGNWSLMSSGSWAGPGHDGSRPTHPDAWSKFKLGYLEPRRIGLNESGLVLSASAFNPQAFLVEAGGSPHEYFLLENRRRVGFDAYVPGEGLAIYHVDESQPNQDDQDHYLVDLEQADGRRQLNVTRYSNGDAGDVFPFQGNNSFTPYSAPSSRLYREAFAALHVTNITRRGADIVLDVGIAQPLALGEACDDRTQCETGFCSGGVCCDRVCDDGCEACAVAAGAPVDGICAPLIGKPCDDRNGCTERDSCQAGGCVGQPVACPENGCKEEGFCDLRRGGCVQALKPDGLACDDRNACTVTDVCRAGACVGADPLVCEDVPGECLSAATCDRRQGGCVAAPLPDGTPCSLGACAAGVCLAPAPPAGSAPKQGCGCSAGGLEGAPAGLLLGLVALARRRRNRAS